jgi:hypothetical protein
MKKRCEWAKIEPNTTYHDKEWGIPQHSDKKLFEFLKVPKLVYLGVQFLIAEMDIGLHFLILMQLKFPNILQIMLKN